MQFKCIDSQFTPSIVNGQFGGLAEPEWDISPEAIRNDKTILLTIGTVVSLVGFGYDFSYNSGGKASYELDDQSSINHQNIYETYCDAIGRHSKYIMNDMQTSQGKPLIVASPTEEMLQELVRITLFNLKAL